MQTQALEKSKAIHKQLHAQTKTQTAPAYTNTLQNR